MRPKSSVSAGRFVFHYPLAEVKQPLCSCGGFKQNMYYYILIIRVVGYFIYIFNFFQEYKASLTNRGRHDDGVQIYTE